jgi:hypothetical protein
MFKEVVAAGFGDPRHLIDERAGGPGEHQQTRHDQPEGLDDDGDKHQDCPKQERVRRMLDVDREDGNRRHSAAGIVA